MKVDKVCVYMSGWNGGRLMELHLLCCYMRGAGVVPEALKKSMGGVGAVAPKISKIVLLVHTTSVCTFR